jgi:PAS domain S-box-containing protein
VKSLPNVLVVDDSEDILLLVKAVTRKLNVNIILALSGPEALIKTRGIELVLAIIDIQMPEMNGYELALNLNADKSRYKVPIILMANCYSHKMEELKGYRSGAVDYLLKPLDSAILLSKINVFLDLFNQKRKITKETTLLKKTVDKLTIANDAFKKSEEKYRSFIDNAPDGVFVVNEIGKCFDVNDAVCKIIGYSKAELLKMTFWDFLSEESSENGLAHFKNVIDTGTSKTDLLLNHKNGTKRWCTIESVKLSETRFLYFAKDITERKIMELTLKISEEKYKTILNASPDGILLIDLKGIITEVSEIGIELFGFDSREYLVGKNIFRFFPPDEKNKIKEIIEKTLNEGLVQNVGLKIRKKKNTFFAGEISSTLIQRSDGTPFSFMIIIRDISQRKKLETKQIHADRMANLGEMASGIAHEINQPLNIISMVMDKILFESDKTNTINIEFLKEKANKIFENITRIKNIIDHIRAFSRSHDDYILTAFNINSCIENATSMITEQFKHLGINLNLQLDRQIPLIVGNTYEFEQVIFNLLANAKDAVMEKKSKQKEFIDLIVGVRSYLEDQFIIVEVTDNGIGISNDKINNIILPFYTTKDEGKGTGLGLSICYQIIKEMNGTISITSDRYHGTKIRLVLNIQKKN